MSISGTVIRAAQDSDWEQIFPIFEGVVAAGQTYAYPEDLSSAQARELWFGQGHAVVAVLADSVLGTAVMGPNRPGRGAHIATGSFMVAESSRGQGIGRALGNYLIEWAENSGFAGIQFNAVVESNQNAVKLWQSLGFEILATVPGAFDHAEHGMVGLHVMFRKLNGTGPGPGAPAQA